MGICEYWNMVDKACEKMLIEDGVKLWDECRGCNDQTSDATPQTIILEGGRKEETYLCDDCNMAISILEELGFEVSK